MISRRWLALLLFPCLPAQPAAPLTVGGDYSSQLQRWFTAQADVFWRKHEAELKSLQTAVSVKARQEHVRSTMLELIGGLPERKSPLQARVTGGFERQGYRVENLVFESLPGFRVTANLYLPNQGSGPYPAVLGVAGHSLNGKAAAIYQSAFIGFARNGIAVLAYDPPGQGERVEYFDPDLGTSKVGVGVREHNMAGLQCLLTGKHIARYEVWDGIRAFDYLLTRPEIDPRRIAVAGNSGGGTQAAYLAVFEPRLAAVISSCYITRWRELWDSPGPQDAEQTWPGFVAKGLDFVDFLLAAAPRPFLMTTAIRDFFPIAGARATHQQAIRLFDLMGDGARAGYFEYDDRHGWSQPRREAAYRWLARWFQNRETSGAEPEHVTEEESALYASATGIVADGGGAETIQSLNLKEARELARRRGAVTAPAVAAAIGAASRQAPLPPAASLRSSTLDGVSLEHLELTVEGGVRIPALLFRPKQIRSAAVFVSSFGKGADPDVGDLAKAGTLVLAVDPRGMGESYGAEGMLGYTQAYQTAARAMLIGRNLLEMQAADLQSAVSYLAARPESAGAGITLYAKGSAGPAALVAAVLDQRVRRLWLEKSIISYMDVVEARIHKGLEGAFAPGVLAHFDLPDLLPLLGGRQVEMISPVHPNGRPMLVAEASRKLGARAALVRVTARGESWPLARVVTGL